MKNQDNWKPSKYIYRNGKLKASRDPKEIGIGSRLVADLIAEFYNNNLKKHAKGNLLDLGCGKVPLFHAYRSYISNNTCVDWEKTEHKNDYLDFECDLTKPLPFNNEQFDTIILSDVLEHVPKPETLWSEMTRILAFNGKIIANVPFYYWIHEKPYDYFRYTEFALRYFVETSGLKLIQLNCIGGVPEIIADIFAKNILHIPIIGRYLALFVQWITFFFVKTNIGKKISEETMNYFPFGYFLIAQKVSVK